jgi:hypothetical protein
MVLSLRGNFVSFYFLARGFCDFFLCKGMHLCFFQE